MKIYGLDLSLDHAGVVVLNEIGALVNYCFLTTTKKYIAADPEHGYLLSSYKKKDGESKDVFRLRRMHEVLQIMMNFERRVTNILPPGYFSFEGYAYRSKSTALCQIAELTGYIKHMLFEGGGNIRIHDPKSVKLFATNKGNATKKDMVDEALNCIDIPQDLIKIKKVKPKGKEPFEDYDGPATDIADAYHLARMVFIELQLRSGKVTLENLPEGERRIFLRVTKTYPVNILAREFIKKAPDVI